MSEIKKVIKKHVANPVSLIGILDDLVYSMVLGVLIGEMKVVLEEEKQGIEKLQDSDSFKIGKKEVKKLEALINDLEKANIPASMDVKDIIRQRYMK